MTAPPGSTGQDRSGSADGERRADPGGQSRAGGQSRPQGADLAAGLQRWLIRSGTRSMRRELTGQFRRTFGANTPAPGDVWNTATTEPPPDESGEAPECAWCPVCRAARRIRESGPGLGGQLAGAGDAVAAAVQEALSAFDTVLSMRPRTDPASGRSSRPASTASAGATSPGTAATGAGTAGTADKAAAGAATPGAATAGRPEARAAGAPSEGPDREPDDRG